MISTGLKGSKVIGRVRIVEDISPLDQSIKLYIVCKVCNNQTSMDRNGRFYCCECNENLTTPQQTQEIISILNNELKNSNIDKIKEKSVFKFDLDQTVYYLLDNKIHSAPILSRMICENLHNSFSSTKEQKETFMQFGENGEFYGTCHGSFRAEETFGSKEDLITILLLNV